MIHVSDVKYVLPADNVISKLPDYTTFGCKSTLQLNPDHIPDLHWQLTTSANTILVYIYSYKYYVHIHAINK